jgi:hypothetical protein
MASFVSSRGRNQDGVGAAHRTGDKYIESKIRHNIRYQQIGLLVAGLYWIGLIR